MITEAASSYPLLNVFWTMLEFFAFFVWIWLLVTIFGDLFRRTDISGWKMAAWTIFVLFVPLIGVFSYLITQGQGAAHRHVDRERRAQKEFDAYVRSTAGAGDGAAVQIQQAKDLLDTGSISHEEYDAIKQKALAQ